MVSFNFFSLVVSFDIRHWLVTLIFVLFTRTEDGIDDADPEQPGSESAKAHYVWQYFTFINHTEAKKGVSKNAGCIFCENLFSGWSTARAAAHILARPVMGQIKTGVQDCVAINKKDDDRHGALREAQKNWAKVSVLKNNGESMAGKTRKQLVMDDSGWIL
jgi:hypothetical protein